VYRKNAPFWGATAGVVRFATWQHFKNELSQPMPRRSLAELQSGIVHIRAVRRPTPPTELTFDEKSVWERVVSSKPDDWFQPSTFDLLKAYCRHSIYSDRFSIALDHAWNDPKPDLKLIDHLSSLHERETQALSRLATKMRISQQSTYSARRGAGFTATEHEHEPDEGPRVMRAAGPALTSPDDV
jgi:hypothetical protein